MFIFVYNSKFWIIAVSRPFFVKGHILCREWTWTTRVVVYFDSRDNSKVSSPCIRWIVGRNFMLTRSTEYHRISCYEISTGIRLSVEKFVFSMRVHDVVGNIYIITRLRDRRLRNVMVVLDNLIFYENLVKSIAFVAASRLLPRLHLYCALILLFSFCVCIMTAKVNKPQTKATGIVSSCFWLQRTPVKLLL